MDVARKFFVGLAWLFVLAVAIQFLLAGLGVLGGESMEPHRQCGFIVLHLIPILMLIAAIVGRMGRTVLVLTVVLFLLVLMQPLFADAQLDPRWLRSFHVLNALFIFALGHHLARRGTNTVRPWDGCLTNERGQPNSLQIRSKVSQLGQRVPALELSVLPDAHAESPRGLQEVIQELRRAQSGAD